MAQMTSLLKVWKSPLRLVRDALVPRLNPTFPYALVTSNSTAKRLKAVFEVSRIGAASATQMQKVPRKIYQRSKDSWLRTWCKRYAVGESVSEGAES